MQKTNKILNILNKIKSFFKDLWINKKQKKVIQDIEYDVNAIRAEDGFVKMIILNKHIENKTPILDKTLLICVEINMIHVDTNGQCLPDETITIGNIEESVINNFLKNENIILSGWIKEKGLIRFLFYTSNKIDHSKILKESMSNFLDYKYTSNIKEDKDWVNYFELYKQIKN